MVQAVIGVFDSERSALDARKQLEAAGFNPTNVWNAGTSDKAVVSAVFKDHLGTDEHPHVRDYSRVIENGDPVLVIIAQNDADADRVKAIMENCGAVDIEARAGQAKTKMSSVADNIGTMATSGAGKNKIPVVEEELVVGKRKVDRGTVRIYTRVTEKPVEKTLTLKEQTVIVERRPVDRPANEGDFANEERVIEVRKTAEEPVVTKRARVVEEVEIGRRETQHTETVRDTVRRKDVAVENAEDIDKRSSAMRKSTMSEKRVTP